MQLAADEIAITIGAETVHLRPTLRAALRLERRHGGFDKLLRAVADGSLSIMADIIRETSDRPYSSIPAIIESLSEKGLHQGVDALAIPLADFVFALAGIDQLSNGSQSGKGGGEAKITFADYHTQLYRIATGWLGWSPEEAWNATIAEITEAQKGRVELLNAIFGGSSSDEGTGPADHSEGEIAAGIARLKMLTALGGNRTTGNQIA